MSDVRIKNLAKEIRSRRMSRGWSITEAASTAGVSRSYWGRLEQAYYDAPNPLYLNQVARALDMPIADLHALAGYTPPDHLPSFRPYLRATSPYLSPKDIRDLESYFELLRNKYGIPKDQQVFPPKSKDPRLKPQPSKEPKESDWRNA